MTNCAQFNNVGIVEASTIDQNGRLLQQEGIGFFDEFIKLLEKYSEKKIIGADLEADLEVLCEVYGESHDPLALRYTWRKNDKNKYTPLQFAACHGNLHVVKLLHSETYKERASVESTTEKHGITILQPAATAGYLKVLKYLVENQGLDIDAQDEADASVLHYATYGKQVNIARYLVKKGAQLNILDKKKISVLHAAVCVQSPELVDLFLERMSLEIIDQKSVQNKRAYDYALDLQSNLIAEKIRTARKNRAIHQGEAS